MEPIKILPVYFFKESSGTEPVKKWLCKLNREDRKIIGSNIRTVQMDWPIGAPLIKSLGNKLWEIRISLDNRIVRIIFILHNSSIVLLNGFIKKTQKTPSSEIEIALQRAKKIIQEKQ